jgi:hypothetical protein
MLEYCEEFRFARQWQLFLCACARRVWHLLGDARSRRAVEVGEAYADGEASQAALFEACVAAGTGCQWDSTKPEELAVCVAHAATFPIRDRFKDAYERAIDCYYDAARASGDPDREYAAQADLMRCIFGNPFRPVTFEAAWRTGAAVQLARQMYESRDFGNMPILADALQDAGCDREEVIAHCRDEKVAHVRGCWVVDLVLGKA